MQTSALSSSYTQQLIADCRSFSHAPNRCYSCGEGDAGNGLGVLAFWRGADAERSSESGLGENLRTSSNRIKARLVVTIMARSALEPCHSKVAQKEKRGRKMVRLFGESGSWPSAASWIARDAVQTGLELTQPCGAQLSRAAPGFNLASDSSLRCLRASATAI